MQRSLRVALTGAIVLLLASCGGGGAPDLTDSTKQALSGAEKSRATGDANASRIYIVRLKEPSVAAYNGGIKGFAATRAAKGSKLDTAQPSVAKYRSHLSDRHHEVLSRVGGAKMLHSYGYAFNGFAAQLTQAQAEKLGSMPDVIGVSKDELRKLDTATTPAFLGLSGKKGFWREFAKGEDVVIGIVDSGVWPELKSFSDRKIRDHDRKVDDDDDDDREYDKLRGWKGVCVSGEAFDGKKDCNNKLIGARYYNSGFGGDVGTKETFPYEFISPRDYDGHGTHTASTAGGNADVPATGPAAVLGKVSGMAPRARIAAYKVCWGVPADPAAGCFNSDSVAAIDQAVLDGVDVINFSISGSQTSSLDPVELAFLDAADAGVFVAASAGNAGPAASTVAHPSPWLTTVAAGTHNRSLISSVTFGSGTSFTGASSAIAALAAAPLIEAQAAGLAGANAGAVRLCFAAEDNGGVAVLDPAKVAGKVVVCDRGTNARVNKSLAVFEAGGVGMVLVNTSPNSLNADFHSVPTVHLPVDNRTAVKTYAATPGATAAIAAAAIDLNTPAPFTASFSSRGPSRAAGGNLLKPDIIAPGQDILAGVSLAGNNGREFDLLSGTSMSSPHIAGIAALFKELHPKWSPMAIKSALMTSAGDVLDGANTNASVIFSQGAGHVRPNLAADPGLVYDSDVVDWLGFLCGTQIPASFCTSRGIPVLNPSDLNTASIAIGSLTGEQTVTRRVTNVSDGHATYRASVSGMAGYDVRVTPSALTLARGQTKSFRVTFRRTNAALNAYAGGQLTWTGGTSKKASEQVNVRVPIVARPVALSAPAQAGDSYTVKFGYDGPFSATARGLVAATTNSGNVVTGQQKAFQVVIPAGTKYARFATFDADTSPASDLDMVVLGPNGAVVGSSGGGTSAEEVNLVDPVAGTYTVVIDGFAVPGATGANFTVFSWALGEGAAGNMTVTAPATATTGGTGTIGLTFTGLVTGQRYLGAVLYGGSAGLPAQTIIRVDR